LADPPFILTTPKRDVRWLKAMWYGPFGGGKTHLAATAEDCKHFRDVLFIDVESGDITLQEQWPDMVVAQPHDFASFARVYDMLTIHHRIRKAGGPEEKKRLIDLENLYRPDHQVTEPHYFNTVVIDSLSEVQGLLHLDIMDIKLGETKLDAEMADFGWDQFDISINRMRFVVRSIRDLPMNVIIVCGEQEKNDNGRIRLSPNLQGKLSYELPGFMDVVGRLEASEPNEKGAILRRLYLSNGKNWKAKSRLSTLKANYLDDPTMESIAQAAKLV
jgi:hypothetical protein